jgi:hypothetical protein
MKHRDMTEDEWLACGDPEPMLLFLRDRNRAQLASGRKFRLFACVCCRHIWHLVADQRSQAAVVAAEAFADRVLAPDLLELAARAAEQAAEEAERTVGLETTNGYKTCWRTWDASWASVDAARAALWAAWTGPEVYGAAVAGCWHAARAMWAAGELGWEEDRREQAALVRELFGNPFQPARIVEAWPSDLVVMARELYGCERGFFGLRHLLESFGYPELAEHFVDPEDWHPKGCWVVDEILGKG